MATLYGFTGSTTCNLIIVAPEFFAKLLFKRAGRKTGETPLLKIDVAPGHGASTMEKKLPGRTLAGIIV